jgi:hypothetical protein
LNGTSQDPHNPARSYLTRAETRLSTMHRIAGLFVSGAGLLVLFPAFLNDAFSVILAATLDHRRFWPMLQCTVWVLISAALPLYALYLLVKDLVQFYFTAEHPDITETWFYPRFVLSGIAFSPDESALLKKQIYAKQQEESYQYFLLKRKGEAKDQFDQLLEVTEGKIIPPTRRDLPPKQGDSVDNIRRFGAAFGMTGTLDRDLVDEVAKLEASLVRHALFLRRLVLRYVKALLMFIWTVIVTVAVVALLRHVDPKQGMEAWRIYVIAFLYATWAATTPWLVRRPIDWIYELGDPDKRLKNKKLTNDPDLKHFESVVQWVCYVSLFFGVVYTVVVGLHLNLGWSSVVQ